MAVVWVNAVRLVVSLSIITQLTACLHLCLLARRYDALEDELRVAS